MADPWLGGAGVTTQGFGACELAGDCPHTGIDEAAPPGTPIIDQIAGVVRDIVSSGGFGLHQVIDIGGGRQILLGHESEFAVPDNTAVKPGQIIGYVGSTGYSTGPHLHFEEDVNGRPVDPAQALYHPESIGGGGGPSPACAGLPIGSPEYNACLAITGGASAAGSAASSVGAGYSAIAGSIAALPQQVGHGLADFFAISVHDAGVFMRRQALAAFVGVAVVIALFALAQPQTQR